MRKEQPAKGVSGTEIESQFASIGARGGLPPETLSFV